MHVDAECGTYDDDSIPYATRALRDTKMPVTLAQLARLIESNRSSTPRPSPFILNPQPGLLNLQPVTHNP